MVGGDTAFSIVQSSTGIQLINNIAQGISSDLSISADSTVTQANNLLGHATNPQFVNPSAGDYHLKGTSPAIDAGLIVAEAANDLEGRPPVDVFTVPNKAVGPGNYKDLGCYEYVTPGDADMDGDVDGDDFVALAVNYTGSGATAPGPKATSTATATWTATISLRWPSTTPARPTGPPRPP